MKNLFISTIVLDLDNFYCRHEILYSYISLNDIIEKSLVKIKNDPCLDKDNYLIEIIHFVEDYDGDDLYLRMVQHYGSANYLINYEGQIIESAFGEYKEFILSDFTDTENKFSIGDICEIYRPCDNGIEYCGTGVITRLRPDISEFSFSKNLEEYVPGYQMSYIGTNGNIHRESPKFAQEWLIKVETPRENIKWFTNLSRIIKEDKIDFRDNLTFCDLIKQYLAEE